MISQSERLEWLARRRQGVGASEVGAVMGLSPWKSPYSLWAEKTGIVAPDPDETEPQHWGNVLEPVIAHEYQEVTGRALIDHGRFAVRESARCPVLRCTLDREILPIDDRGPGALEIKAVSAFKDDEWTDGPPLLYQIQIQAQLAVTGWRWGSAAVLIGGQSFRWCDVERNDAFIAVMERKCVEFWRYVETNTPPPVDGSSATAEILKMIYPKDTGETVALPGEALSWGDTIAACNERIKAAEAEKREAQNKLIAAIGSATFGVLPGGGKWSYKTAARQKYRTLRRSAK